MSSQSNPGGMSAKSSSLVNQVKQCQSSPAFVSAKSEKSSNRVSQVSPTISTSTFFSVTEDSIIRKNHFSDLHYWFRQYTSSKRLSSLSLNACIIMMAFLNISGRGFKKTIISLQALWIKLSSLNQTCILSKSMLQISRTTFPGYAVFFEHKRGLKCSRQWCIL